jgi:glyoxylase-like metal-dependent hydrolase (beta-lactamase superfamily II)
MRMHTPFAGLTLAAALFAASAAAQSHLELKVHTGHGQTGYDVIDPQFSLSEAHRLAAEILESKKNLTTIHITHPHPDHLFGLAVLKQAFPGARIVALPATANAAKTAWPARQKFWFPTYGNNIPGPDPVVPEELTTLVFDHVY